jgi:putative molybdopterin biosynthesis protein
MRGQVGNRVEELRNGCGLSAAELASRVHVTRQTIYSIEAGTYVPNTRVALHLARELHVKVDELFSLTDEPPADESFCAAVLSVGQPSAGQPVRVCQIGSNWIGVPVTAAPYYLPDADGVVEHAPQAKQGGDARILADQNAAQNRIVMAGCDPAGALLANMVHKISGVEVIAAAASSKLALRWLCEGKVHIAGSHLEDARTGEFNLPFLKSEFPRNKFSVITLARWEQGLVAAAGNPKHLRSVADLGRKNVRMVNREPGSGSRALLDKLLKQTGLRATHTLGYKDVAIGHLAAAWTVLSGSADACIATRAAAQAFGLNFIPLHAERYDLVMLREMAQTPAVQALLNVLHRADFRRKLELLAGYDTSQTGTLIT